MSKARPEVVALLVDMEMGILQSGRYVHRDGRPFTDAEHALAGSAVWVDVEAARDLVATEAEFYMSKAADASRVVELLDPYFARFPDGANVGDALAIMPEAERAECIEIMERTNPDGYVYLDEADNL